MNKEGMMSEEKCWQLILANFNRYFRAKYLIDLFIAEKFNTSVRVVNSNRKKLDHPFRQEEKNMRGYIGRHLAKLEKENKIEKHSYYVWKIIDGKAEV